MPRFQRFISLEKELYKLRKYFLPRKLNQYGLYTERQLVHANSYRVLAHAEIEDYFEDRVKEIALSAVNAWKSKGKIRRTLICLFAFSGMELEAPPQSLTPKQPSFKNKLKEQLELDKKIDKVHRCFISCINDNHGIKEKNTLTLLLPIGINSDDLDEFWLNSMNFLGENRGIIAHTSASSYETTQLINPKDELDNIEKIVYGEAGVQGLKDIDELLNTLMK